MYNLVGFAVIPILMFNQMTFIQAVNEGFSPEAIFDLRDIMFCFLLVETFLELLEPYILKDMLASLPPGVFLILDILAFIISYLFACN